MTGYDWYFLEPMIIAGKGFKEGALLQVQQSRELSDFLDGLRNDLGKGITVMPRYAE
jgi:hypothetical protein